MHQEDNIDEGRSKLIWPHFLKAYMLCRAVVEEVEPIWQVKNHADISTICRVVNSTKSVFRWQKNKQRWPRHIKAIQQNPKIKPKEKQAMWERWRKDMSWQYIFELVRRQGGQQEIDATRIHCRWEERLVGHDEKKEQVDGESRFGSGKGFFNQLITN